MKAEVLGIIIMRVLCVIIFVVTISVVAALIPTRGLRGATPPLNPLTAETATSEIAPPSAQSGELKAPDASEASEVSETLVVTPPPPLNERQRPVKGAYFPYTQSMSPHIALRLTNDLKALVALGFFYQLPNPRAYHWEFAADAVSDGSGHFTVLYKRIFSPRDSLRPYIAGGIDVQVKGSEGLPTFARPENWGLTALLGIEDLIRSPMSLRADMGFVISQSQPAIILQLGYSWAW